MKKIAVLFMMFGLFICGAAAFADEAQINDVGEDYWASKEIRSVVRDRVMLLYDGFLFKPENDVRRGDFNSALLRALNHQNMRTEFKPTFKDISPKHWAYNDIAKSQQLGLIYGYPDNTFRPDKNITKAEAASIISHITQDTAVDTSVLGQFTDANTVPAWDTNQYAKTIQYGIYVNHPDEEILLPNKNLNRAETAVLLHKLRMKLGLIADDSVVAEEPELEEIAEEPQIPQEEPEVLLGKEHLNVIPNPPNNEVWVTNKRLIIKAGNVLTPTYIYPFNSKKYQQGDVIRFDVMGDVKTQEGTTVIPAGSVLKAEITELVPAKMFNKSAEVRLNFVELMLPSKMAVRFPAVVNNEDGILRPSSGAIAGKVVLSTLLGAAVGTGAGAGFGCIDDEVGTGIAIGAPVGAGVGLLTGLITPGLSYQADQGSIVQIRLTEDVEIYNSDLTF